jgi:hypothetical protein
MRFNMGQLANVEKDRVQAAEEVARRFVDQMYVDLALVLEPWEVDIFVYWMMRSHAAAVAKAGDHIRLLPDEEALPSQEDREHILAKLNANPPSWWKGIEQ